MSLTNAHDPALKRSFVRRYRDDYHQRDRGFAVTFAPWSDWRTGAALNFVDNCLLVGFTVVRRDALQSVWL